MPNNMPNISFVLNMYLNLNIKLEELIKLRERLVLMESRYNPGDISLGKRIKGLQNYIAHKKTAWDLADADTIPFIPHLIRLRSQSPALDQAVTRNGQLSSKLVYMEFQEEKFSFVYGTGSNGTGPSSGGGSISGPSQGGATPGPFSGGSGSGTLNSVQSSFPDFISTWNEVSWEEISFILDALC